VRYVIYHSDSVEVMMMEGRTFLVNLEDKKGIDKGNSLLEASGYVGFVYVAGRRSYLEEG